MMNSRQTNAMPRKSFAQVAAAANASETARMDKENNASSSSLSRQERIHPTDKLVNGNDPAEIIHRNGEDSLQQTSMDDLTRLNNRLQSVSLAADDLLSPADNSDTRSVASRTTMTLDEKESLRPDDSASMQAAADQDTLSAVDDLRPINYLEENAFHDQLRQINLGSQSHKTLDTAIGTNSAATIPQVPIANLPSPVPPLVVSPLSNERPPFIGGTLHISPDEKLLEALASPPDRVFVLKVEQDLIDFVKNPREQQLELPQMNSFYRMLSHKLADYYMLGHTLNDSMTAVRIIRTSNHRLPPRLIDLRIDSGASTPSNPQARKILRRQRLMREAEKAHYQSLSLDKVDSQFSSNAPSESGAGSGGDDPGRQTPSKNHEKSALTLEERESRYKEARARIFGPDAKVDMADSSDAVIVEEPNEVSRSSSTSGAKKTKKQRKPKDDTFESRSAYSQMNGQVFPNSALANMSPVGAHAFDSFNSYHGPGQNTMLPPSFIPSQNMQYGGIPTSQSLAPMQSVGWYNPAISPEYSDGNSLRSGDFIHHQTFSSQYPSYAPNHSVSSDFGSQETPRATYAPMSGFPMSHHSHGEAQTWSQSPMYNSYASNESIYPGMGMSSPTAAGYNFSTNQVTRQAFSPNEPMHHGSFDRAQFNPNSQIFVPSSQFGPFQQSGTSPMNVFSHQISAPMQQQISGSSQASPYVSSQQQQVFSGRGYAAVNSNGQQRSRSGNQAQNTSSQSSIAKWGTPPTLPPKPPPPAVQSPYFDLPRDPKNEQPLPQHPFASNRQPNNSALAAGSAK